jgi:integrase
MASINKLASGKWRVQVRCKGHYLTTSFSLRKDAEMWARRIEREIDLGQKPAPKHKDGIKTVSDLIDLHIADMTEVGKVIGRSKAFSLDLLRARLGRLNIADLNREQVIKFGKGRAEEGAGPVTVGIDIGYVRTLLVHGAAVHGLPYSAEPVELGRVALTRLGLVGKGNERDRRPTLEEIEALIRYFRGNNFQIIPVDKIIRFAIATAMRLGEICSATWEDLNDRNNTLLIRDRKDPRHKKGNHMRIPLLDVSGYDARAILEEQRFSTEGKGRIFPYNGKSAGTAFRRACHELEIEDLHFHDLRHEGTSRLFEAGFTIEQVAMVTGHKDWKMLRRYTHLRPEQLHVIAARLQQTPPSTESRQAIV